MQYSFKNDYSEGAHPKILNALSTTNNEQVEGYGRDRYCLEAASLIQMHIADSDAAVHFVSGGTQANAVVIGALLKPYQAVIAADTGHINVHEAGAIERCGHKVLTVRNNDGRVTCRDIKSVLARHSDEHMVAPKMVYLSSTTETGTIYTRRQLTEISDLCRKEALFLYLDGARIGCALTADGNDLTLADIHRLVDVFYIGGTKNGALIGEAVVIRNRTIKPDFRYYLKQNGALLSKSRVFGIQFCEMFRDNLFFDLALHANRMALKLAAGIEKLGYGFLTPPATNQIFPILPNPLIDALSQNFAFYVWHRTDDTASAIRLVTSWATREEAVGRFLGMLEKGC